MSTKENIIGMREILIRNLAWIITTLIAIGAFAATTSYQGEVIANTRDIYNMDRSRINEIEKNLVRMEAMQKDITEMKEDIKEIKKIVLRPAFN